MFNLKQFFMQKKNLFGIALLCASVFLFTGCKEIMSHFDNSVDSHLQVADKLTIIGVGDTYQITKDVDYKTISDADPSFESLDKAIATVEPKTGLVTALKSGDARIKISLPDNGLYLDASAVIDIKVRINTFKDLKNELTAEGVTEVKAYLADAANIVWEGDMIDVTGKKVAIIGGTNTTMAVKKGFQIDNDFAISNVKIDFSEQGSYFVGFKNATEKVVKIGDVTFENIEAKNMKQPLFNSKKSNYLIENISIINSVVEMGSNKQVLDFSSGSSAYNVNFENSTIYSTVLHKTATYKSQGGQKLIDLDSEGIQTFNLTKSTFYNLSCGGMTNADWTNFFSHRQNSQKWLKFVVKENIFVNCGKSKQVIQGLNGGGTSTNPKFDVDSNVFNYNGADESGTEVSPNSEQPNKNNIAALIVFKDAANGDFTQSNVKVGDPRWIK
jgi:hypothetical protein